MVRAMGEDKAEGREKGGRTCIDRVTFKQRAEEVKEQPDPGRREFQTERRASTQDQDGGVAGLLKEQQVWRVVRGAGAQGPGGSSN